MGKAGHEVFCYRRRCDIITSEGPYTKHVLIDGTKRSFVIRDDKWCGYSNDSNPACIISIYMCMKYRISVGFANHYNINNILCMYVDRSMWWCFGPQDMTYVKLKRN